MSENQTAPSAIPAPKNKKEGIVFGLLMSYFMAYGMEVFNVAVKMGYGANLSAMTNAVFLGALKEASYMGVFVFIFSNLWGNRLGARFAENHKTGHPYINQLLRQAGTVGIMCPTMSMVASILFNIIMAGNPVSQLIAIWVGTVIKNFPIAFFWNMFGAAPLTRLTFSKLFR